MPDTYTAEVETPSFQAESEITPEELSLITYTPPVVSGEFASKVSRINRLQLWESSNFKLPRLQKIRMAENLYAGKILTKNRIEFNIPLPVLSGMVDTMLANMDDPIHLKFKEQDPADWAVVQKINALYEKESKSTKPGGRWAQKDRWMKKLAMFSGRGIMKYYAESDPSYCSNLEVVDYYDFHCEPRGGGHLENHAFAGQEGIWRTVSQLQRGAMAGIYDKKQVATLLTKANSNVYKQYLSISSDFRYNRFRALGLNPEQFNYIGEATFHLAEWVTEYAGERWYCLFDPWTGLWIRFEKLTDIFPSGYFPWVSWATHEDPNVFWSKAFATDELAPIADTIITLFNQEVTNRQKQNYHPRFFDMEMFPDIARLDESQHRPEALVPVDTKGGTRKIQDGLYEFEMPGLTGTVNLIDFLSGYTGKQLGVTDQTQGDSENSKKVGVALSDEQATSKRFDYRSQSFSSAWGEEGVRFIDGLKEHMPPKLAIRMLGPNGWGFDEIRRIELNTKRELDIDVSSSSRDEADDRTKVAARAKAHDIINTNPILAKMVNPRWQIEQIYRDIGGYKPEDIALALDPMNYGSKEEMARAAAAVQDLIEGKDPAIFYGAGVAFVQYILDWGMDHKDTLGPKKTLKFIEYVKKTSPIVQENMARKRNLAALASGGADPTAMGLPEGQEAAASAAGQGATGPGPASTPPMPNPVDNHLPPSPAKAA